jgi:hypothetical protein
MTRMDHVLVLTAALTAAACGPSPLDGDGAESETGFDEIEDCEASVKLIDKHGRAWGRCERWTAWASLIDEDEVEDALEHGDWVPTDPRGGAHCYLFSPDAIVCTPRFGDLLLFTRPLEQLEPINVEPGHACAKAVGAWDWTWSDGHTCRGVLSGDLVVRLKL